MTVPAMISELMKPEAYAESPGDISLLQTHISFVILTDRFVYKIKKPIDFGFLDFTTLEKRQHYCRQEVELNSRLSPDIYLEVLEIKKDGIHYRFDGDGETVDYAVKMKRLQDEAMLISLLKNGSVDERMLDKIAEVLAGFHARAAAADHITSYGSPGMIAKNIAENFSQTKRYIGKTISEKDYTKIKGYSKRFLHDNKELFLSRMAEGRIRDCHGDVHMEHVYIMDGQVNIVDCIEFNERFRYSDVAADIAFLAMDLDFYGRTDLSDIFVERYMQHSRDTGIKRIVGFYKCYRAYVRGKVESFEIDDPNLEDEEKERVREIAGKYFKLALGYAAIT